MALVSMCPQSASRFVVLKRARARGVRASSSIIANTMRGARCTILCENRNVYCTLYAAGYVALLLCFFPPAAERAPCADAKQVWWWWWWIRESVAVCLWLTDSVAYNKTQYSATDTHSFTQRRVVAATTFHTKYTRNTAPPEPRQRHGNAICIICNVRYAKPAPLRTNQGEYQSQRPNTLARGARAHVSQNFALNALKQAHNTHHTLSDTFRTETHTHNNAIKRRSAKGQGTQEIISLHSKTTATKRGC